MAQFIGPFLLLVDFTFRNVCARLNVDLSIVNGGRSVVLVVGGEGRFFSRSAELVTLLLDVLRIFPVGSGA